MSNQNEKIYITKRTLLQDSRGSFLKIINGNEPGNPFACEVYISSAKPGESRGGHYHLKAREWFTLIKGKALLTIIDIDTLEKSEIALSETEPETIYISQKMAHSFKNTGEEDFILIAFTDVKYDPADTISYPFYSNSKKEI